MNIQRVKELLAAWEAGAAREDELAELRRLLPAVIEAAERYAQIDTALREMADGALASLKATQSIENREAFAEAAVARRELRTP